MSSQAFSSKPTTSWRPLAAMLLLSFAVHLALLALRPFGFLPHIALPPPALSVTLAPAARPAATEVARAAPPVATARPTVAAPRQPAPPERGVGIVPPRSHPAPPHHAATTTPPARAHGTVKSAPQPAHPTAAPSIVPDEPAPSFGGGTGRFDPQSLLAQGRNAARALDGADDASDAPLSPGARQQLVYGRTARGIEWNSYVEAWRLKMEQIGTRNYPEVARDQQATLRLAVIIDSSGALRTVKLLRSSGQPAIDQAAIALVSQAAPFAPFPPALAARASALRIERQWSFTRDNRFAGG